MIEETRGGQVIGVFADCARRIDAVTQEMAIVTRGPIPASVELVRNWLTLLVGEPHGPQDVQRTELEKE